MLSGPLANYGSGDSTVNIKETIRAINQMQAVEKDVAGTAAWVFAAEHLAAIRTDGI